MKPRPICLVWILLEICEELAIFFAILLQILTIFATKSCFVVFKVVGKRDFFAFQAALPNVMALQKCRQDATGSLKSRRTASGV